MNRHQKVAIIIAPFLGIGGYIAADYYMTAQERAAAAQPKLYQLEQQSACNLRTVSCVLQHDDLSLTLFMDSSQLALKSNHDLQGVKVAFGQSENLAQLAPTELQQDENVRNWSLVLGTTVPSANDTVQVVAKQERGLYLAEFALTP